MNDSAVKRRPSIGLHEAGFAGGSVSAPTQRESGRTYRDTLVSRALAMDPRAGMCEPPSVRAFTRTRSDSHHVAGNSNVGAIFQLPRRPPLGGVLRRTVRHPFEPNELPTIGLEAEIGADWLCPRVIFPGVGR